jgi:5-aminolevulinate synthase
MIEGVRRSGCEKKIFRHNDLDHLEELLKAASPRAAKLIAFESVYSMDGDIAPIARSAISPSVRRDDLSRRGACGRHVRPARRRHRRARRRDGPHRRDRGHARQGFGCSAATSRRARAIVDAVRSYAPGFIFTTALPPASARRRDLDPPPEDLNGGSATAQQACGRASKAVLDAAGLPVMAERHAHRAGHRRRRRKVQAGERPSCSPSTASTSSRSTIRPCRAAGAPADHADALPRRRLIDRLAEALVDVWHRLGLRRAGHSLAAE